MLCKNSAVSRKRNKKLSFSSFRGQQFWQQLIIMILNLLTYLSFYWLYIEAVIRGVLLKKVFLEISQNSQENSCARVSFLIKLQALGLQLYLKRDSGTGVFLSVFAKFAFVGKKSNVAFTLRLLLELAASIFLITYKISTSCSLFLV